MRKFIQNYKTTLLGIAVSILTAMQHGQLSNGQEIAQFAIGLGLVLAQDASKTDETPKP